MLPRSTAKPADLPNARAVQFVINRQTARTLGIVVPPTLLAPPTKSSIGEIYATPLHHPPGGARRRGRWRHAGALTSSAASGHLHPALRENGFVEGSTVEFDFRWAHLRISRH
jgi:hypothetical protein